MVDLHSQWSLFFRWWELSRWPTWVRWPLSSTLLAGRCQCCPSSMTSPWVCCPYYCGLFSGESSQSGVICGSLVSRNREMYWTFPQLIVLWCRSCISSVNHCILFRASVTSLIVLEDWCCSSKDETGRKWLQCWKHPWIGFHNGFPDAINCASTI